MLLSSKRLPNQIHEELRKAFASGKLNSIAYRKYQLLQLAYLIQDNTKRFEDALAADLGRPALESDLCVPLSVLLYT
jgi:aldehyde dehydrogenase (NAD+)